MEPIFGRFEKHLILIRENISRNIEMGLFNLLYSEQSLFVSMLPRILKFMLTYILSRYDFFEVLSYVFDMRKTNNEFELAYGPGAIRFRRLFDG